MIVVGAFLVTAFMNDRSGCFLLTAFMKDGSGCFFGNSVNE